MATVVNITVNTVENNSSVRVVKLEGELDESNLPQFEEGVSPVLQDASVTVIIFDFGDLAFMSSKAIGYFASVYNTLKAAQRDLVIAQADETIKDILALVGLDQLITIYPTLDEALQSVTSAPPPTTVRTSEFPLPIQKQ